MCSGRSSYSQLILSLVLQGDQIINFPDDKLPRFSKSGLNFLLYYTNILTFYSSLGYTGAELNLNSYLPMCTYRLTNFKSAFHQRVDQIVPRPINLKYVTHHTCIWIVITKIPPWKAGMIPYVASIRVISEPSLQFCAQISSHVVTITQQWITLSPYYGLHH